MAGWIILGGLVNLIPLEGWQSAPFAADEPIALAVAFLFSPLETALIMFFAAFDPRELRGEVSLGKSLWNRSQISCAWLVGSLVAHLFTSNAEVTKATIPIAVLILAVASILNYSFVASALAFERRFPLRAVVRRLKIGLSVDFLLSFLTWGILGSMLIVLYGAIGNWSLVAFLAPSLLSRQVLQRSQGYVEATRAYRSREGALEQLSKQVDKERADERRLIAGDLHDEILQPLFKVSLMSQVLRNELDTLRLAEAEGDLQELIDAADMASDSLRNLIGDLRRPGVGSGGLGQALRRLIEVLKGNANLSFHLSIEEVHLGSQGQLVIYQVAKESLTNVLHHSGASNLWIELRRDGAFVLLTVRDDGHGFDPYEEIEGHYGIQIMKERVAAAGGNLFLDTAPGGGCAISLILHELPHA
jgi:signal transduction histidine kinase